MREAKRYQSTGMANNSTQAKQPDTTLDDKNTLIRMSVTQEGEYIQNLLTSVADMIYNLDGIYNVTMVVKKVN